MVLQREGFNRIGYSGDYMPTYPSGGIGVTEEKIRTKASEVLAFVKGSLKGLQFAGHNRSDSVKIMSEYLGIKNSVLGEQLFELYLNRRSLTGSADEVFSVLDRLRPQVSRPELVYAPDSPTAKANFSNCPKFPKAQLQKLALIIVASRMGG